MKKTVVALFTLCATGMACAQAAGSSKVELWGIVDAAVRHTTNEGPDQSSLTKMIGGGMSQSRWGINVEEDMGNGVKALVSLESRFNADTGEKDATAPTSSSPTSACRRPTAACSQDGNGTCCLTS